MGGPGMIRGSGFQVSNAERQGQGRMAERDSGKGGNIDHGRLIKTNESNSLSQERNEGAWQDCCNS
jgi:hypothetical protein